MKRLCTITIIITYLTAVLPIMPAFTAEKSWVAVIPFQARNISEEMAGVFFDAFHREIINSKRFNIVERERIEELLKELALQQTGCTDSECVIQIGRMANADKVIAGTLTKVGDKYIAESRVVDLTTAKIEFAESAERECPADELPALAKELVDKIVSKTPLTGKIIETAANEVYVNLGKNDGLAAGMELDILRYGKEIVDEETGDVVMREKKKIGTVKITTLDKAGSKAEILSQEQSFQTGDIVSITPEDYYIVKQKLGIDQDNGSKTWLWIGLGAAAAIGAGVYVATSSSDDGGEEDTGTGSLEINWGW